MVNFEIRTKDRSFQMPDHGPLHLWSVTQKLAIFWFMFPQDIPQIFANERFPSAHCALSFSLLLFSGEEKGLPERNTGRKTIRHKLPTSCFLPLLFTIRYIISRKTEHETKESNFCPLATGPLAKHYVVFTLGKRERKEATNNYAYTLFMH